MALLVNVCEVSFRDSYAQKIQVVDDFPPYEVAESYKNIECCRYVRSYSTELVQLGSEGLQLS